MRYAALVLALWPAAAYATPSVAELEARARTNLAPKLDLMCGTSLAVRYDPALARRAKHANEVDQTEALCEAPLRWLFYVCSEEGRRRTIASAHLRGYECRVAKPKHRSSIEIADGVLIATWAESDNEIADRIDELEKRLGAAPQLALMTHDYIGPDRVWSAFVAAPAPAVTSTSYCEVDGKRVPLPTTGDPLVPRTARVRCVSKGKIITDLVPEGGGYTGFSTIMEDDQVVFRTWRKGYLDGESWQRKGRYVVQRTTYVSGRISAWSYFSPEDGALRQHALASMMPSKLVLNPSGEVMALDCGDTASSDAMFRDYCGYDRPRKVTVHDQDGVHTYTYDKGQITAVKD